MFIIAPPPFYNQVLPRLRERGIDVALVCGQNRCIDVGDAEWVEEFEVMGGRLSTDARAQPVPLSAAELAAVREHEGEILEMVDRLNCFRESVHRLRWLIQRISTIWKGYLDHYRPAAVLFHATPHMCFDYTLYALCKHRGIATIILDVAYLDDLLFFRDSVEHCPGEEQAGAIPTTTGGEMQEVAAPSHLLDNLNLKLNNLREIRYRLSLFFLAKMFFHPLYWKIGFQRWKDWRYAVSGQIPLDFRHRVRLARAGLAQRKQLREYERVSVAPDLSRPFVYFPLHFQPERTTLPGGGHYTDQWHLVQTLSRSLPDGWQLIVKEHPRQFRSDIMWRNARWRGFYEQCAAQPGVVLATLDTPSNVLIAHSQCMATITGTAGWEGLQAGKPVLVFGYPFYRFCPGVHRVSDVETCRVALDTIRSVAPRVDRASVQAFIDQVLRPNAFRGCFSELLLSKSTITPEEQGELLSSAIASQVEAAVPSPVS